MTTNKYVTTYSSSGYFVQNGVNLFITGSGGFGGSGVVAEYGAEVVNDGRITADAFDNFPGAEFFAGGLLINGSPTYANALITGGSGVLMSNASGTVENFGTIAALSTVRGFHDGVDLYAGGVITNGSASDRYALIQGAQGAYIGGGSGTITNLGRILGQGSGNSAAVRLNAGGSVTNGASGDTQALIEGGVGVDIGGAGALANFGVITGSAKQGVVLYGGGNVVNGSATDASASIAGVQQAVGLVLAGTVTNFGSLSGTGNAHGDTGVQMNSGGSVYNGSLLDRAASIDGYSGVVLGGAGGRVFNYGSIQGEGTSYQEAGVLMSTGVVINGRAGDTGALIEGASGVMINGLGTVANFGVIIGAAQVGVSLAAGGKVTNGDGAHRSALIEGYIGLIVSGGAGTITNGGTIEATGDSNGVAMTAGGTLTNGAIGNTAALIEGYIGMVLQGATATNFAVISALGQSAGVYLQTGGVLINGAQGHAGAVVDGYFGVQTSSSEPATVTNFGTISGADASIDFASAADVLNVEAGSTFTGAVLGGAGTLDLASGAGTISNFGNFDLTVSGSMAATAFTDFHTLKVGSGASFVLVGSSIVSNGQLIVQGGTLTVDPAVSGTGKAVVGGGTLDFVSTFKQAVSFGATGVLELGKSQTYTGSITGFSLIGATSLDLADIAFTGSGEASYSGTAASGTLTVTDGTHTAHIKLIGNYLSSTFVASSDGHGGTTVIDPKKAPALAFIAAMASMAPGAAQFTLAERAWRKPVLSLATNPHAATA